MVAGNGKHPHVLDGMKPSSLRELGGVTIDLYTGTWRLEYAFFKRLAV